MKLLITFIMLTTASGCELTYPEVTVVNATAPHIQLRNISFNGCQWNAVLEEGSSTSPKRCLPGEDHVHFQKLDAASYCAAQAEDGTIPGVCHCDPVEISGSSPEDPGLVNEVPTWFNYRTVEVKKVESGGSYRFEVTVEGWEQDFSVTGPYGH